MEVLMINEKITQNLVDYTNQGPQPWFKTTLDKINSWGKKRKERKITLRQLQNITNFIKQNVVLKNSNGMWFKYSPYAQQIPNAYKYKFLGDVVTFKIEKNTLTLESISRENVKNSKKITIDGTITQKIDFLNKYLSNTFNL